MASERLGESLGIREDLIKKACLQSFKSHKSPEKHFLLDNIRTTSPSEVIVSFPGCWTVSDWFTEKDFGETQIDLTLFPSLRSIGVDEPALVNKAFLRRFDSILANSSLKFEVNKAMTKKRRLVFTGHSSGAPMAILASLWTLEHYPNPLNPPFCVTFGSPLIGNRIFSHATRRENWSRYFIHFITRHDIVPRISLAPISSLQKTMTSILQLFNPKSKISPSHDSTIFAEFYDVVMRNAAAVASHSTCNLMGCTNLLLETARNFVVLSPYRPFGTYVWLTGITGRVVVVRDSEAVLQVMFHGGVGEGGGDAKQRIMEHMGYVEGVEESLGMQSVVYLEKLEEVPLSGDSDGDASIDMALNDLGLGTRARLCLRAAGELEKQKHRNETKIDKAKAQTTMKELEDYREVSRIQGLGYYDTFKLQRDHKDFQANVKRLVLAGVLDEIIEMLKRYELPDDFEAKPEWVELGTRVRRLVEPLDIANYYRHLKNEDTGPYMDRARPKRYRYTQRWLEHGRRMGRGGCSESLIWAEVEELIGKSSKGQFDEDFKRRVLKVEQDVKRSSETEEIGRDVLLEGSSFMKWWRSLPREYKAGIL